MQILRPEVPQLNVYDRLDGGEVQAVSPGYQNFLTLTAQLRKDLTYTMTLVDSEFNFKEKPVGLGNLPADFVEELRSRLEDTRKSYGGTKPSGVLKPPPPRLARG